MPTASPNGWTAEPFGRGGRRRIFYEGTLYAVAESEAQAQEMVSLLSAATQALPLRRSLNRLYQRAEASDGLVEVSPSQLRAIKRTIERAGGQV